MKNCVDPAVLVPEKKTFFSLQVTVFNPGNSWIHFFIYVACFFMEQLQSSLLSKDLSYFCHSSCSNPSVESHFSIIREQLIAVGRN